MSAFGAGNKTPSTYIPKSGFVPETHYDPFYGPNEEEDFILRVKDEQHAASMESRNSGVKKTHIDEIKPDCTKYEPQNVAEADTLVFSRIQIMPRRATVSALRFDSFGNVADVSLVVYNLQRQLKIELNDAERLNTIKSLTPEEQEMAYGVAGRDVKQLERNYGEEEGPVREIINILVLERQQKGSDSEEALFDIEV
ncbi:hypothetical protein FKW77_006461 [Venturia effusa]|uniref:Uncharacterized protein n=1 Tax=Venturia effusa TaxID=50376 RepID=A0A517LLP2_9PEZI|nr:hypothetical protein FKW77_006461 [Venturia effusa]